MDASERCLVAFIIHFDALGMPQIHARSAMVYDVTSHDDVSARAKCGFNSKDAYGRIRKCTLDVSDRCYEIKIRRFFASMSARRVAT
jgi:hypothetical protein